MGTWDPPRTPAPPGFGAAATGQRAGVGARILAWIIDAVLLWVVTGVLYFLFNLAHIGSIGGWLGTLISLAYWTYCWGSSGQTLGYRVMHIRAVNASGGKLGYGMAFVRGLLVDLSFAICLIPAIVSLIMMAATEKHQAIHDLILGTAVVDA